MKPKATRSPAQRLWDKLPSCWPALKGSLARVYKPCIRPHCPACASGRKHPNYLLSFTQNGRRRCLYVPLALVPVLRRALANGRRVEKLLYEMGPALVKDHRARHPARTGPAVPLKLKHLQRPSTKS